jgi:hypothetical protein
MEAKVPAREKMCRRLNPRQISWKELFPRITIVNDPKKLAELRAEVQKRKLGLSTTDRQQ